MKASSRFNSLKISKKCERTSPSFKKHPYTRSPKEPEEPPLKEPPLKGHGRGADALELAARERGLEQVRRVDGALRRPGADERVPRCERAARACKKIDFLSADFRINLTRLVLGCIKAVANRYSFAA